MIVTRRERAVNVQGHLMVMGLVCAECLSRIDVPAKLLLRYFIYGHGFGGAIGSAG